MYNTDFLPQLEASRRHLFGSLDTRDAVRRMNNYVPPSNLQVLPCVEDTNGEWVPQIVLEERV
ncbi:hypothetical protein J4218_06060 [Candidatus Pacearchaeota archaeon]|nr:hypothetical protein [Candidatus Pacearchaeota archaeon]